MTDETKPTVQDKAASAMQKRDKNAGAAMTVRDLLESDRVRAQIKNALPRHMTPERMIRIAYSAISRNPSLLGCDQASLIKSVIEASELGLEPSGILGHAYLVPFRNNKTGKTEAQLQVGYRGFIELAHRSGRVRSISAEVVYEGDVFVFERGSDEKLRHVPCLNRTEDAKALCAYATVRYADGGFDFEVCGLDKIASARKASKAGGSGPWVTHWEEMARKTAIRRLAKRLPLSPELMTASVADEVREAGGIAAVDVDFTDAGDAEQVDPETGEVK